MSGEGGGGKSGTGSSNKGDGGDGGGVNGHGSVVQGWRWGAPGRSITPSAVRTTPPRGETQRMPPSNLVAVPQGRQRIESFTVL